MGRSGGGPSGKPGERWAIGLISTLFGVLLLVLILLRGQQAAREGNQELRNDTYWMLVSPLVFAGFGLYLMRTPAAAAAEARRRGGGGDAIPARLLQRIESSARETWQRRQSLEAAAAAADQDRAASRGLLREADDGAREAEQRQRRTLDELHRRLLQLDAELTQAREGCDRACQELKPLLSGTPDPPGEVPAPTPPSRQRLEDLFQDLDMDLRRTQLLQDRGIAALLPGLEQLRSALEALRQLDTERGGSLLSAAEEAWRHLEALGGELREQLEGTEQRHRRALEPLGAAIALLPIPLDTRAGAPRDRLEAASRLLLELDHRLEQALQDRQRCSEALTLVLAARDADHRRTRDKETRARQRIEQLANRLSGQLVQARTETERADRVNREAQELLERLQQQGKTPDEGWSAAGDDARTLRAYREACAELGVVPGSSWTAVRASWRRHLKQWHPDQGGDAGRWNRRNGAYELLAAWHAFADPD
jgi:DNA repair exonuclease SbcCD ATPase subunit